MYKAITSESTGPLEAHTGQPVENYEDMSTLLTDHFRSLFAREDRTSVQESVQVYEGGCGEKLRGIIISRR